MTKTNYLISGMFAGNVNVVQNIYCAGIPSPSAFIGIASIINHELGFDRKAAKVLPIFHNISVSRGRTKADMQNDSGRFKNSDMPEDMVANIEFSMLIQTQDEANPNAIKNIVKKLKISGAPIFGDIEVKAVNGDGRAFRNSKRGYVLLPFFDEENKCISSFGEKSSLEKVCKQLSTLKITEGENKSYKKYAKGNIVPVAIGYKLIRSFKLTNKKYYRDKEKEHFFGEPGVGIAEFVSVRNSHIMTLTEEELDYFMFKHTNDEEKVVIHETYL